MIYYKIDSLSMTASVIIAIIEFSILFSPFVFGWIVYSYIFSKLIYSFAKRYLNINISFSRTWTITCLSGMTSFIIILIFIFLHSSYSVAVTTITVDISKLEFISIEKYLEIFTANIVTVFITSLVVYKYLSNASLRVAIVMSFATLLVYLTFTIIVISIVLYIFWYIYIYPWSHLAQ